LRQPGEPNGGEARRVVKIQPRFIASRSPATFLCEHNAMSRNNPNIEDPTTGSGSSNPDVDSPPAAIDDPQPVPPDVGQQPPVETPPDQPGLPEGEPTPTPIGDPVPNEPTRLV
jgi:hypothetical protein